MSNLQLPRHDQQVSGGKRSNLMSIISSLHQDALRDDQYGTGPASSDALSVGSFLAEQAKANLPMHEEPISESTTSNASIEPPVTEDEDAMSNILKLLCQVSSNTPIEVPHLSTVTPPQDDESVLEMQQPPEGEKSGIQGVLKCYADGTEEVRSILKSDVNFLYECKRCRGIFRSLPSLIRHKKDFCKNTGLFSSFMNRSSNSTKEEDTTFQRVLDILHPPEPAFDMNTAAEPVVPVYQPFPRTGNEEKVHIGTNLQPMRVNLVRMTSSQPVMTSVKPVVLNSKPVSAMILSSSQTATTAVSSTEGFGKFFVGRSSSHIPGHEKRYACPLCEKPMAERKNVRRHLINVHMLRVTEALKIMNSKVPTKVPAKSQMTGSKDRMGPDFLHQCVETIKLGPNRVIHVLPETYNLSSSYCPVCSRVLCRKTNVRRHILEAHNLIIKGEKKYFQLKEIAGKAMTNSPTLRALRFMFASRKTPNLDSSNKSLPSKSQTASSASVKVPSKPVTIFPFPSTATKITETPTSNPNIRFVTLNNVKFVETSRVSSTVSTSPALKSQIHIPKVSSTSFTKEPMTMVEISRTDEIQDDKSHSIANGTSAEKDSPNFSKGESSFISNQVQTDLNYKCPQCPKSFTRRHAFKNHMGSFHKLSDNEFDQLIEKMMSQKNVTQEPTRVRHLSSDEEPPPKKLRALAPPGETTCVKQENPDQTVDTESLPKANGYGPAETASTMPKSSPATASSTFASNITVFSSDNPAAIRDGNVMLKGISTHKPVTSTGTSTTLRPFIKVELKTSSVTLKGLDTKKQVSAAQSSTSKLNTKFDFKKLICYSCEKKFISAPDMKRHLLGVHSFSAEDALAACYDCSRVSEEAQSAGLENGFDITLAKCLYCDRLYFSRENLYKHLSRTHHVKESLLEDLKVSFIPQDDEKSCGSASTTHSTEEESSPTMPLASAPATDTEGKPVTTQTVSPEPKVVGWQSRLTIGSTKPISISGNAHLLSKEDAAEALKVFPKQNINPSTLRCTKCKHKYQKLRDFKIHLLKHLRLGLYACRFCQRSNEPRFYRSSDLMKHLAGKHNVRRRYKESYIAQCRINLEELWEVYDLPPSKSV